MVSSWLIKVVLGIALVGAIIIEVGSPLVAKTQASEAAQEVADETSFAIRDNFTQATLDESCESESEKRSVKLIKCEYDTATREVVVRVQKEARSLFLKNWSATEDWYLPEATARARHKT